MFQTRKILYYISNKRITVWETYYTYEIQKLESSLYINIFVFNDF